MNKLPDSIIKIGDSAFEGCISLENIILPSKLEFLGKRAFANCKTFTTITIPSTVTHMGEGVFDGCERMETINIFLQSAPSNWDKNWLGDCKAKVIFLSE